MYEIILTLRPNFAEQVVASCASEEEALALAQRLSQQWAESVIRVLVRRTRQAELLE